MKIWLDGQGYELKAGTQVIRQPLVEFPANIRIIGQQRREDRSLISSWRLGDWNYGFGIKRGDAQEADDMASFWDSEVDTRFPGQVIRAAQPIHVSILGTTSAFFEYHCELGGNLYFQIHNTPHFYRFIAPATIGSHRRVGSTIRGVTDFAGDAYFADYDIFSGWAHLKRVTPVFTIREATYDPWIDAKAKLLALGENIYAAHITGSQARIYRWNISQGTVYPHGTLNSIATFTEISPLYSDGAAVYLGLPEGIYDIVPAGADSVLETSNLKDTKTKLCLFGNNLYFKNLKGLYCVNPSNLTITPVGLDLDEGLPFDKTGEITAMAPSWKFLFAAVKGATHSHIFAYDNMGWHFLAKIPSVGATVREMFISSSPDSITRLWLLFSSGNPNYILNPLDNPLTAGTYCYAPTGHIDFVISDFGLGEIDTGIYDVVINQDVVNTAVNNIEFCYGLDSAIPTTSLGLVATLSQQFNFGGGLGVKARRLQPRLILSGTVSGTSSVFRDAVIHYLKLPKTRETFTLTIDLKQTSIRESRPVEALIGSLNACKESVTLLPFWYGKIATKNVKVLEMPALEEIQSEDIYADERVGMVTVRLAELI